MRNLFSNPRMKQYPHTAFTLIELLVVIAIIAILLTSESVFFMSVYANGVLKRGYYTKCYNV